MIDLRRFPSLYWRVRVSEKCEKLKIISQRCCKIYRRARKGCRAGAPGLTMAEEPEEVKNDALEEKAELDPATTDGQEAQPDGAEIFTKPRGALSCMKGRTFIDFTGPN